ncbi:MAG TPA: hypothetical protein PK402_06750, partial [Tepidisphaeraceae bacterium]|nr:hypothetical protein [Tepidisphaeraceae bacterium]
VYLAGFFGYLVDQLQWVSWITIVVSALLLVPCRDLLRDFWGNPHVRRIITCALLLILWSLVLMSTIRSYSGALWFGDWFEHYERTEFFARMNEIGIDHQFLDGRYQLPARPPFQNVVTAVAIAPANTGFDSFAFAMSTLNALIAPAGMLLLATMARRGRRVICIYAALLALSPMFLQNVTFTWTKLYAGFYALAGLHFFLRAYRTPNLLHLILSGLFFAAGSMVHYSIVPYVLVLAIPFIGRLIKNPRAYFRPAIIATLLALLLISTWVAFSFHHYGIEGTIKTNTTITDSTQLTLNQNLVKIAKNLRDTFIPMWSQNTSLAPTGVGYWRDRFFVLYQTTFPFLFGSAGICLLLSRPFWRSAKPSAAFWVYYVIAVSLIGVIVHGSAAMFGGLAHVALTPLAVHGLAVVALVLPELRERFWLRLVAFGFLFDAVFGIIIHWFLQSRTVPFSMIGDEARWAADTDMTKSAFFNLILKEKSHLVFPFDYWPLMRWPLLILISLTLCWLVIFVTRSRKIV